LKRLFEGSFQIFIPFLEAIQNIAPPRFLYASNTLRFLSKSLKESKSPGKFGGLQDLGEDRASKGS